MIEGEKKENKGKEKIAYHQTKLPSLKLTKHQKKIPMRSFHVHLQLQKLHNK